MLHIKFLLSQTSQKQFVTAMFVHVSWEVLVQTKFCLWVSFPEGALPASMGACELHRLTPTKSSSVTDVQCNCESDPEIRSDVCNQCEPYTIISKLITKLICWEFSPVMCLSKITEFIIGRFSSGSSLQAFIQNNFGPSVIGSVNSTVFTVMRPKKICISLAWNLLR